jgi:diguanylate cyclase (GGDEF)-like protein
MVAGVTAGSITLSAAIPSAAVLFLFFSIFPLIVSLALLGNNTYLLFDIALILYLIYSIILTFRVYDTIKSSFHLQFENDDLLDSLEVSNIKLEHAATHDPLTHLANRRLFVINLRNAIYAAKEQNHHFALFFIDLDHFKAANDLYGHQAGDQVLLAVTDRLRNYFRKDDMIARLGGDELAIIIEHVINIHEIAVVAQKICRIIEDPIDINDTMLKISASIGISIFPFDGTNEEALLHNSDSCMYYVKENGGNNYHFTNTVRELT